MPSSLRKQQKQLRTASATDFVTIHTHVDEKKNFREREVCDVGTQVFDRAETPPAMKIGTMLTPPSQSTQSTETKGNKVVLRVVMAHPSADTKLPPHDATSCAPLHNKVSPSPLSLFQERQPQRKPRLLSFSSLESLDADHAHSTRDSLELVKLVMKGDGRRFLNRATRPQVVYSPQDFKAASPAVFISLNSNSPPHNSPLTLCFLNPLHLSTCGCATIKTPFAPLCTRPWRTCTPRSSTKNTTSS